MEDRGDRGRLEDIRGRVVASAWHNARESQHVLQREPLYRQTTRGVFFVVREKAGMKHKVVKKVPKKDLGANILSDETIRLTGQRTSKEYPGELRRVRARVQVDGKWRTMVFLTSNFEWAASAIAELYKARWEGELLFKELKLTLQLQDFYGENGNAVEECRICRVSRRCP